MIPTDLRATYGTKLDKFCWCYSLGRWHAVRVHAQTAQEVCWYQEQVFIVLQIIQVLEPLFRIPCSLCLNVK